MKEEPWIAVDLDATLADYHGWKGVDHVGAPIAPMVAKVKQWLADGKTVKIFTARLHNNGNQARVIAPIKRWCKKYIGRELEVTNVKTQGMIELWDDRAFRVAKNGVVSRRAPDVLERGAETFRQRNGLYNDNYHNAGKLLLALFPNCRIPEILSDKEAAQLSLIVSCACKLQRYAYNLKRGGHPDSAHDLMVYAAMLEELTEEK